MNSFETEFRNHEKFFYKMAHTWGERLGIPFDEALSLCWEAFYDAYQNYDPSSKASLTTYSTYRIMGTMTTYYRHNHKEDTSSDIEDHIDIGMDDDTLDAIDRSLVHERLDEVIENLADKEKQAVRMHYWKGMTGKEIGKEMGLSPQRVSQLLSSAEDKLRLLLKKEDFYDC